MPLSKGGRLPFDAYDFFGYLIPGFFFFLSLLAFEHFGLTADDNSRFASGYEAHCPPMLTILLPATKGGLSWVIELLILAAALVAFYIAGHVIAAFSSLGIERMFVQKVYGYPHETLLRKKKVQPSFSLSGIKLNKITYIFFLQCTNISLILIAVGLFFDLKLLNFIAIALLLFTLLLCLIAFLFYLKVLRKKWDAKLNWFMSTIRWIMAIFGAPYLLVTYLIAIFIRSRESFDEVFQKEFHDSYKKEFLTSKELSDNNMFWFSYMFVIENTSTLGPMISKWLHLYGFARNLSTSCYLSFICMVFYLYYYNCDPQVVKISGSAAVVMALALFLACIMAIRYYYLYNGYYSKFTIRAFVYSARHPRAESSPRLGSATRAQTNQAPLSPEDGSEGSEVGN